MGIRKSTAKNKKSKAKTAAAMVERDETLRKASRASGGRRGAARRSR